MPGIVIESRKLVYWPVPKCACTSIKTMIAEIEGLKYEGLVHDAPFRWTDAPLPLYDDFAVVRHPADRLRSLWRNKIAAGHPVGPHYFAGIDTNVFGGLLDTVWSGMAFPEFAEAVTSVPTSAADPHWAPQTGQIPRPAVCVKLEQAWPLLQLLGPSLNVSPSGGFAIFGRALAAIRDYYAADYERFGYER